jgi:hypothetical protein
LKLNSKKIVNIKLMFTFAFRMKKLVLPIFLFVFTTIANPIFSQRNMIDSAKLVTMLYATYQYQFPGGDLVNLFGSNSNIGGGVTVKIKSNWTLGVEGGYIFGDKVKNENSLFSGITTSDGNIIDGNGVYTEVHVYERGYHFQLSVGKVFPLWYSNPNSGIWVQLGAGFLEHKIRIETPENSAPQLLGDYKKGYDKLSNGLMLAGTVGYLYLGKRKLTNFFIGLEFLQAYTKSRRDYDFNLQAKDTKNYSDFLSGIKVSWIIPIYNRGNSHVYY